MCLKWFARVFRFFLLVGLFVCVRARCVRSAFGMTSGQERKAVLGGVKLKETINASTAIATASTTTSPDPPSTFIPPRSLSQTPRHLPSREFYRRHLPSRELQKDEIACDVVDKSGPTVRPVDLCDDPTSPCVVNLCCTSVLCTRSSFLHVSISFLFFSLFFAQSGISVVKTPQCSQDSFRLNHCPTCSSEGRALAEGLPCAHHGQSFLICRQVNRGARVQGSSRGVVCGRALLVVDAKGCVGGVGGVKPASIRVAASPRWFARKGRPVFFSTESILNQCRFLQTLGCVVVGGAG